MTSKNRVLLAVDIPSITMIDFPAVRILLGPAEVSHIAGVPPSATVRWAERHGVPLAKIADDGQPLWDLDSVLFTLEVRRDARTPTRFGEISDAEIDQNSDVSLTVFRASSEASGKPRGRRPTWGPTPVRDGRPASAPAIRRFSAPSLPRASFDSLFTKS